MPPTVIGFIVESHTLTFVNVPAEVTEEMLTAAIKQSADPTVSLLTAKINGENGLDFYLYR